MIDVDDIQELYRFNRWANTRTFDAVSSLPPEAFVHDLGSSFPSVRDTLVHIISAEWIWLQRWKGSSPPAMLRATEFRTFEAVKARWEELDTEQRAFVETVTRPALASVLAYTNLRGERWQYDLWRQMYHVVNHSSYHRGQIVAMLRQLGAQAVSTDYLIYCDELPASASGARS